MKYLTRMLMAFAMLAAAGCGSGGGGGGGNATAVGSDGHSASPAALSLVEVYHDNGRLAERGSIDADGKRYGSWEFWYDNGQQRWQGSYIGGHIDGTQAWREYNRDGSTRRDWQDR
jgi:hypothetical protein